MNNVSTIALDLDKISCIEWEGIDWKDYPDFCDAFISKADYDGREMTDEELDELNSNSNYSCWRYEQLESHLY